MSLISRYILKAHLGPFFFGFAIITFILVMDVIFEIVNLIIGKGLDVWIVLEIFVLNLAWIVALSIPMAVLVATLMAFGRFSADNEITALKAGGVSFYRMIAPVFVAGVIMALGNMVFMDMVLPEANYQARSLMNDVHRARPTLGFREGIFMEEFSGYSILIDRINPRNNLVSSITIYETGGTGPPRVLTARQGRLDISADAGIVSITLFDGELHQRDPKKPGRYYKEVFERQRLTILTRPRGVVRTEAGSRGDRELTVVMMEERIDQWRRDMDASRTRLAVLRREENLEEPGRGAKEKQEEQIIQSRQRQINGFLVEIYKKQAIPVACLVFVLIGAPLGLMVRRSGLGISVGVSLGFFLMYWACLIGGEEMADRGLISPFLAMWGANFLIGVSGILMVIRTARER